MRWFIPTLLFALLTMTTSTAQVTRYATPAVKQASQSIVSVHASGYLGSGTYVGDDLFVTCEHVVDGRTDRSVMLHDPTSDRTWIGRVIYTNPKNDIAIIKVASGVKNFQPVRVAKRDTEYGQRLFGVGFGASYKTTELQRRIWSGRMVSRGSIHGSIRMNDFTFFNKAISGDSGGACLNARGELVGVVWGASTGRTHCVDTWAIRKALEVVR